MPVPDVIGGMGRGLELRIPVADVVQPGDPDRGLDRVTSVGVLIGAAAAVIAAAAIWLVVTDPVTVATAVEDGEISPLVVRLAEVLYNAISGLLEYL
jgi:hypothetical protein